MGVNFKINGGQKGSHNDFLDFFEAPKATFSYVDFLEAFAKYLELGKDVNLDPVMYAPGAEVTICPEPITFIDKFFEVQTTRESRELFENLMNNFKKVKTERSPDDGIWFNKTSDGINLRPGRGNPNVEMSPVVLGDQSVHGLVVGRTGSGKSVFLNNLLFNLITEYPPWELDIFLADFKKVELSRYMTCEFGACPHVRACAATSEIRYVVSLLTYVTDCMRARENFLKKMGLTKIADLRKLYQDKNLVLPRVLILIDEFQQMFLEATSRESMVIDGLLTTITKLGRATGFHLLFASQEMSGTLSAKVFANFKAKFALPCDAEVSNAVLGNSEAAEIFEKGIVLVNTKSGSRESNIRYNVPFIPDDINIGSSRDLGFYQYLQHIVETGKLYDFNKIQKFYDEDYKQKIDVISTLRNASEYQNQMEGILSNSIEAYESLLLGCPVVFNSKRVDYETAFLERGKKKNIGIICNQVQDIAYVSKLLAENFKTSASRDNYVHNAIIKNPILSSVFDITAELNIKAENIDYSADDLSRYIKRYEANRFIFSILQQYESVCAYLSAASSFIGMQYLRKAEEVKKAGNEEQAAQIMAVANQYQNYTSEKMRQLLGSLADAPTEQGLIDFCNKSNHNKVFKAYIDGYINYRIKRKPLQQSIPVYVFWVMGMENMESLNRNFFSTIADSMFYNVLYIFCCTADDGLTDYIKQCDYLFLNTPDERIYNRYGLTYTKKDENSIVIDFKIRSTNTERSFKKFHYIFRDYCAPFIDFDAF